MALTCVFCLDLETAQLVLYTATSIGCVLPLMMIEVALIEFVS